MTKPSRTIIAALFDSRGLKSTFPAAVAALLLAGAGCAADDRDLLKKVESTKLTCDDTGTANPEAEVGMSGEQSNAMTIASATAVRRCTLPKSFCCEPLSGGSCAYCATSQA